jgi:hypothetical protein
VPKPTVLDLGQVKVIKKGVLIHPLTKFSPEELEYCKSQSPEMLKSRGEQESSTQLQINS